MEELTVTHPAQLAPAQWRRLDLAAQAEDRTLATWLCRQIGLAGRGLPSNARSATMTAGRKRCSGMILNREEAR